jgi:hypothetical protein
VLLSISAAKGTARKLTVQELVTTVHGSVSCDLVMEGNNELLCSIYFAKLIPEDSCI